MPPTMALGTPPGPVSNGRVHPDRYHRAGAGQRHWRLDGRLQLLPGELAIAATGSLPSLPSSNISEQPRAALRGELMTPFHVLILLILILIVVGVVLVIVKAARRK
jgi:hypothetical protein